MKVAYFPGCSADSTGISFSMSTGYVAPRIGLELQEIEDWSCCGASAGRLTNSDLANALAARALAVSERNDPDLDVVAPCAGCYLSLKSAQHYARQNEGNRAHIEELIRMPYQASNEVMSLLELMVKPELRQSIADALTHSLDGLKLACYYGCALVRPVAICDFDDPEYPTSMDDLMSLTGAECVDWAFKTECCGGSFQIISPKGARKLVADIYNNAARSGAEAIVTACPLCFVNLDMRLAEINANRPADDQLSIPVYFFTEVLGMAMGADAATLGITKHFWPAEELITRKRSPLSANRESGEKDESQPADPAPAGAANAKEVQA